MTQYVLFWFDVEDYIEPLSDEALKGLLQAFEAHGVQATWKLVGEKARVLARRGRRDIIRLLQRQDLGYHTDTHSQHPVLAEYLEPMGWEDGIRELVRREAPGYADLVRICGPASTFGQAGGSWAPHLAPLMRELGIPLFMDEASHVGLDGGPFWYGGVLHVNRLGPACTRMDFQRGAAGLQEGIQAFDRLCTGGAAPGLISIYYHPCEFATRGFWDGANFARGANPPRADWQSPPRRTPGEMAAGLDLFSRYLHHIATHRDVEVLTGRQLLNLLPDRARERRFTPAEIAALAAPADGQVTYRQLGDATVSAAELYSLVARTLAALGQEGRLPGALELVSPAGPTRRCTSSLAADTDIPAVAVLAVCADTVDFMSAHGRMPDRAWLGSQWLSPADFMVTAADLLGQCLPSGALPTHVRLRRGHLALEHHIRGHWGWVVFPEGFAAPRLVELAQLQTWTLKPALLTG